MLSRVLMLVSDTEIIELSYASGDQEMAVVVFLAFAGVIVGHLGALAILAFPLLILGLIQLIAKAGRFFILCLRSFFSPDR